MKKMKLITKDGSILGEREVLPRLDKRDTHCEVCEHEFCKSFDFHCHNSDCDMFRKPLKDCFDKLLNRNK